MSQIPKGFDPTKDINVAQYYTSKCDVHYTRDMDYESRLATYLHVRAALIKHHKETKDIRRTLQECFKLHSKTLVRSKKNYKENAKIILDSYNNNPDAMLAALIAQRVALHQQVNYDARNTITVDEDDADAAIAVAVAVEEVTDAMGALTVQEQQYDGYVAEMQQIGYDSNMIEEEENKRREARCQWMCIESDALRLTAQTQVMDAAPVPVNQHDAALVPVNQHDAMVNKIQAWIAEWAPFRGRCSDEKMALMTDGIQGNGTVFYCKEEYDACVALFAEGQVSKMEEDGESVPISFEFGGEEDAAQTLWFSVWSPHQLLFVMRYFALCLEFSLGFSQPTQSCEDMRDIDESY